MAKKDVKEFLEYCSITAGDSTLIKLEPKIRRIDEFFNGKLEKLTLKDLHSYLAHMSKKGYAKSTKNDNIKVLKRFVKWKFKDWNVRFDELKDFKAKGKDQRNLSKEDLLTPTEMELILNSIDSLKFKTILLFLQETACRPEEVLKVKWKDINFDKEEVKLHSSKTDQKRTIPINKTLAHLRRYRTECFYQEPRAEDKVFDFTYSTLFGWIHKVEKKLKFPKHLYPYLWRHSVLTRMIKELSPKVYEMYAGHSLETGMRIYAHLDNDDLRKELDEKIYKIEKLTKEDKEEIIKLKKHFAQTMRLTLDLIKNPTEKRVKEFNQIVQEIELR